MLLTTWPPAPASLEPEPGWVHIFKLALDLSETTRQALRALLSANEQARADRFLLETSRQHFIAAHAQMRAILAGYTKSRPADLRFITGEQGKPALTQGEPRFSLSHSGDAALLAVSFGWEVGVDIEQQDRRIDYANVARRFFAPAETARLLALPPEDQPQAFFAIWTRKEAYLKARGLGLSIPLDSFEVSVPPETPLVIRSGQPGWSLYALDPGPGLTAALVVEGAAVAGLRCWNWR